MANNIVFDLDFEQIKENLRTFLQDQTNVTQDGITTNVYNSYDFDGSSINAILNLLAYSTHYTSLQSNLVASEAYLDSASLRSSILSKIKPLSYIPSQKTGAVAKVNISIPIINSPNKDRLIVPEGTLFSSTLVGSTLSFYTIESTVLFKDNHNNFSGDLTLRQGKFLNNTLSEQQYIFEGINVVDSRGIRQRFLLSNLDVDINSLKVIVGTDTWTNGMSEPNLISPDSNLFFLQETESGKLEIFFGDNIIGVSPKENDLIKVKYSISEGSQGNGFDTFILNSSIESLPISEFIISTINKSEGGVEKETNDSIKINAPAHFQSQGRAVVASDYTSLIKKIHPDIKSISAYGGEKVVPSKPGKVFVSIQTISGYPLSPTIKQSIITKIGRLNVGKVDVEIIDNNYIDVNINSNVLIDSSKTNLSDNALIEAIISRINTEFSNVVGLHSANLVMSKLSTELDKVNTAIIGNTTEFNISHKLVLSDQKIGNYIINLGNNLKLDSFLIELKPPTTTKASYNGVIVVSNEVNIDGKHILIGKNIVNYPEIDNLEVGWIDPKLGIVQLSNFKPSKNIGTSITIRAKTTQTRIQAKLNTLFRVGELNISIERQ